MKKTNRRIVVFSTLVTVLTLTSALLLALAPAPLTTDASTILFAIDAPESMDLIYHTQVPVQPKHWKYIYIHHSRTLAGNGSTLGRLGSVPDHFVIGNGDGAIDGQVQVSPRWDQQLSADAPAGAREIDPNCISICLIGDFDQSVPTPTQIRRLTNLVNSLQGRLDITPAQILFLNDAPSVAGVGRYFPAAAFREQLLP